MAPNAEWMSGQGMLDSVGKNARIVTVQGTQIRMNFRVAHHDSIHSSGAETFFFVRVVRGPWVPFPRGARTCDHGWRGLETAENPEVALTAHWALGLGTRGLTSV